MTERKPKVLIIDDEEDLVEMLAMRLQASGLFDVETAYDGPAGLDKARHAPPDVVLLDNVMPLMEGWEVCRRLRADPKTKSAKIIIMTAGSPTKSQKRARDERVEHVLLKPYDHEQLLELIKSTGAAARQEGSHA